MVEAIAVAILRSLLFRTVVVMTSAQIPVKYTKCMNEFVALRIIRPRCWKILTTSMANHLDRHDCEVVNYCSTP
jgi:hypothetical protein